MNTEDDYFDGDMSDEEYRQRIKREKESELFYAQQREIYKQKQLANKVYYSPSEDEDEYSGGMW